jgi:flavin-binding protein dodecin
MSVIKIIELVGESPRSWEEDDKIHLFRVRAEVSFRLER